MNYSVCRNGKLPMGFSTDSFPHFYYHKSQKEFVGVFVELWNTMSHRFGCSGLGMHKYDKQLPDELNAEYYDGALLRNEVFAPIDTVWLRESDTKNYRYSAAAIKTKMSFAEAREGLLVETTELSFFVVFPTDVAAVLIAFLVAICLLNFIRCRLRRRPKDVADWTWFDLARGLLLQFSILFVVLLYQGHFRGNSLTASSLPKTLYSSMVADFKEGRRKLVLNQADNYFSEDEIPAVVGSNSSIHWQPSALDSLITMCSDPSLVGLYYETDIYGFFATTLTEDCFLSKIRLPPGESTGTVWLTHSIREGDWYYFVISKSNPRVVMERINWALLTVFTQDNMDGFLRRRNLDIGSLVAASLIEEQIANSKELPPFFPLTFKQITIPLEILGGGLILSAIVFAVEFLISRFYSRLREWFNERS